MQRSAEQSAETMHQAVQEEIDGLLKKLGADVSDCQLAEAMEKARATIEPIRAELVKHISALGRAARWDKFTIACYGETNAGKSTFIETLRILLNEQTKADARAEFRKMQAELGLSEETFAALRTLLEETQRQWDAAQAEAVQHDAEVQTIRRALDDLVDRLSSEIVAKKRAMPLWRKLLMKFRKLPEELELARQLQQRDTVQMAQSTEKLARDTRHAELQRAHQALKDRLATAQAALDGLKPFADGCIIGTGQSDFTRETKGYRFTVGGQAFELLDVPGIEGTEALVMEQILDAVRGAHAVLYVTRKPSPPQTGADDGGTGTLEKIRNHLGDQAEVWTIFNKAVNNPMQLQGEHLVNEGEREGLAALDATMREELGENRYQGHRVVSALPAFYAVAECLVPSSDVARNRAKFLNKLTPAQLLEKSRFRALASWLTGPMVENSEARIRIANVAKVRSAIKSASGKVTLLQRDKFAPLAAGIKKDWSMVDKQLELAVTGLKPALLNRATEAVQKFENEVRRKIYARIDDGIDNDDLKQGLERIMCRAQETLESELPDAMRQQLEKFQRDVAETMGRFHQRVEQLQDAFRGVDADSLRNDVSFDFQFDNGIKYMPLIAALAGGLMMIWNPVGWVSLALGGLTLVVSIAKAVWGFFDSDYKKSQQRKAANETLDRTVNHMKDALKQSCDEVGVSVGERIDEIRLKVKESVEQAEQMNAVLTTVCTNLERLSRQIEGETV